MGFTKRMAAALPNNIVKNHGTNVNQIQFGDKLQGLVSVTNRRVGVNRHVRTKCGGQLPGRATVHCVNQLGGVGNVKNTQFAPNADGAKECKHEVYGETRRDHDYIHRDSDKTTQHVSLPVFSSIGNGVAKIETFKRKIPHLKKTSHFFACYWKIINFISFIL